MDIHSQTREGKYEGEERLKLIHQWVDGRMPVIGIGSVFTADDALDAVESTGIELVALGRGILLDYNFIHKIEEGKEEEIISYLIQIVKINMRYHQIYGNNLIKDFIRYLVKINN